jgi:hypothetical protein
LCATAGAVVGFPLQWALLGLGTGAALAGARRLAQVECMRDLEAALLPVGGALGAALVTLLFGVLYLPQLAAAAIFGWGAGLAAVLFLTVRRRGAWWRTALGVLAAAIVVHVYHALSLMTLWTWLAIGSGAAAVLLALLIEMPHDLLSPPGRLRSLGFAAASGAVAGLVYGLASQWWYGLGGMLAWQAFSSEWATAVVVGIMIGSLAALLVKLSGIAAEKATRAWHMPAYFVLVSAAFGLLTAFIARNGYAISVVPHTFWDDVALGLAFAAAILTISHRVRSRARPVLQKAAVVCAVWFSLGVVWGGPWPHAAAGFLEPTAARSLAAMIPWKTSPGSADASRPQLVHFTRKSEDFRSITWSRVFVAPENAPLAKRFRCVKLTLGHDGETQNSLGVRGPCVVFLAPDGREIDRFTGG